MLGEEPMQAGHARVVDPLDAVPPHLRGHRRLLRDREIGGPGRDDDDEPDALGRLGIGDQEAGRRVPGDAKPRRGGQGVHLRRGAGGEHVRVGLGQPGEDRDDLLRRLAGAVHRLGRARAKGAMRVHAGVAQILERKPPEPREGVLRRDPSLPDRQEELHQPARVHHAILATVARTARS